MENNNYHARSILIADDHQLVVELVKLQFEYQHLFEKIDTAYSKKETFKYLQQNKYDIVLLDMLFDDGNIAVDLKNIIALYPESKIILFTGSCNKKMLIESFKSGIRGFILKTSHQSEITEAIKIVLNGDKYYCKDCLKLLVEESLEKQHYINYIDDTAVLTVREKEILKYIVDEFSVKEIADKLCISQRTVETHKRNIMEKFDTKTTLGLVKKVIMKNLLNELNNNNNK